jgi:hypothetical protein
MLDRVTKQNAPIGSKEHEEQVNEEAKRLGFSKEIFAFNEQ